MESPFHNRKEKLKIIGSLSSMLSPVEYQKRAKKLGERLRFNIVVSNVQRGKDKYVATFSANPSS